MAASGHKWPFCHSFRLTLDSTCYIQDQAVIRVKQLEEETQMLKKSLEDLVAEAGERTKREAEEIR